MKQGKTIKDEEMLILQAAHEGFIARRARIDEQIADIRMRMTGGGNHDLGVIEDIGKEIITIPAQTKPGRRQLSAAARHRISMAQKKRWAAVRKEK
jgi:hypothetical protein